MADSTAGKIPLLTRSTSEAGGVHILSQKVARALELKTDTPEMLTALDALVSMDGNPQTDAKSIRTIMDKDAMHQALLFQKEFERLLGIVKEVKHSVSEVTHIVGHIQRIIEHDVIHEADSSSCENNHTNISDPFAASSTESKQDEETQVSYQKEHEIARELHQCFMQKNILQKRYETLQTFLEKFEMTPEENELLEYYNFNQQPSQISIDGQQQTHQQSFFDKDSPEGFQFLDTLDKVRKIRAELSKTLLEDSMMELMVEGHKAQGSEPLGATSALRMMEHLAQKQERAYERLYHFLQFYLQLNVTSSHVPTSSAQQRQSMLDRMDPEDDDEIMEERLTCPFVKRALGSLSTIHLFHSHLLELIAGARRSEVTRRFLLALTSGYQHAPPIEMRAHDPTNYVGDMLAFVFRSFSVECDLAKGLFLAYTSRDASNEDDVEPDKVERKKDNTNSGDNNDEEDNDDSFVSIARSPQTMVSHSMSGVARPLKARILQVVSSLARRQEESSPSSLQDNDDDDDVVGDMDSLPVSARNRIVSLYSICGLLLFYNYQMNKTMERMLTQSSQHKSSSNNDDEEEDAEDPQLEQKAKSSMNPLRETTSECLQEAAEAYAASLKVYGAMLTHFANDDEPEAQLAITLVQEIIKSRQSSPGFESHVLEFASTSTRSVLSLEFVCNTIFDAAVHVDNITLAEIKMLQDCVLAAKTTGLEEECAEKWQENFSAKKSDQLDEIIQRATGKMLHDCGLGSVAQAIWSRELSLDATDGLEASTLPMYPGLSPEDLKHALAEFEKSLYSPPVPLFVELSNNPSLKSECRSKTAANVAETYEQIYETLIQARDQYGSEFISSVVKHTPQQVKTLLLI